ncbi:arylsulfatase [Aureliella helgolandensis]|nr:arylsulfatase [Aureliella helgolandensis]
MFRTLSPVTLVVAVFTASALAAAAPPNVIIVLTDDQGYGELSLHGNPILATPNLDRLGSESIRLTDFHVAPMCTPTRGQLMTGIDALRNGAMNVSSGRTLLRSDLKTMANHFSLGGYQTGIFGKWHLGDNYPYRPHDRGFDTAVWFPSSHINSVPDHWNNDYFDDTYLRNEMPEQFTGYCTDVFFDEAMAWMKSKGEQGQPFFTYLPTNAPHGPHFVPDKYRTVVAAQLETLLPTLPPLNKQQQTSLVSFLAMIANIDENMGRLESFLVEQGLRENTIVIFMTDNGSTMGPRYFNAGMRGGKVTLWEGGHRVPCFIRWPAGKLQSPTDLAELTQVQDILPTLLDLCELPDPSEALDGTSLAALLRGTVDELQDRMLVINYSRMPIRVTPNNNPAVPQRDGAAVLWKRWRLLQDRELYDLATDPLQQRNVIDQHPDVVQAMRTTLNEWWDRIAPTVNEPQAITIGSEHEPESKLTACEWFDVFVDQQGQVRAGVAKNGQWHLRVAEAGEYEFELRRWPREAEFSLAAGCPALEVTDGTLARGKALPIHSAVIEIGEQKLAKPASDQSRHVTFRMVLPAGDTQLRATFLDAQDRELCGAYYVYVHRMAE